MTIGEKIACIIESKGITKTFIAKELGITSKSLSNKLDGKTAFKAEEVGTLAEMFGLSKEQVGDIFLG